MNKKILVVFLMIILIMLTGCGVQPKTDGTLRSTGKYFGGRELKEWVDPDTGVVYYTTAGGAMLSPKYNGDGNICVERIKE
jgi:major membrane immunogen (membrane-anchored lipoprotein)